MLLLAKIMYNYSFDGTIIVWIIGLPFIVLIVILRQEQNFDYILINSNNYEVLAQPMNQLTYLTKLVNLYHSHKGIAILIDGFLDYHRCLTSKEDTNTKRRVLKTTKFSKMLRQQGECEQVIMVIAVMQGMYYYGLQKFPNNTRLRILYALYLLDKMQTKQQALQELLNAELERPSFDEQFIIYRYKIIIENSLIERSDQNGKKGDNYEMVNELSVQTHLKQCRTNIEKSANLHLEFWSQLSEDAPDLGKLSEIGYKINIINQLAEEQWKKLQQNDSFIPSMMRLYAKFMIEILNDKDGGEEILMKLCDSNAKNAQNKTSGLIDLNSESKPTVFISAEEDSFGIISNINLAASGQLGYNKMEILNRNVKVLMPNMYSKYHDTFIESYLSSLESRILNIEKQFPGKNKLDYIVPLIAIIRHVPSLIHGLQFVAQFRVQKTVNLVCYMLVDSEGKIQNTTSTSINIFLVDQKRILKKKMTITDAVCDFYDKIKEIQMKNGFNTIAVDLKKKSKEFIVNIQAQEVQFRNLGFQGYYVRVEKVKNSQSNIQTENKDASSPKKFDPYQTLNPFTNRTYIKSIQKNFQMKYDPVNKQFLGNLLDGPPGQINEEIDQTIIIPDSSYYLKQAEEIIDNRTQQEKDDEIEANKPKYGFGIKTLRLFQGKVQDVEDIKRDEDVDDDEQNEDEQNQTKDGKQEIEEIEESSEIGTIFKNRQSFISFTQSEQFLQSSSVKTLRRISTLFMIILAILCLVNHFLSESEFSQCMERYQLLTIKFDNQEKKEANIKQQKDDIEEGLKNMQELQNYIQLNTFDMLPEHKELFSSDSVEMKFKEENTERTRAFDINEATQMLVQPSYPAYGINSFEYLKGAINQMYILNSNMQKEHSKNLASHHANYVNAYESVMMNNKTCGILTTEKKVSTQDCYDYANGTIMQGFAIALPRHIENFRMVATKFEKLALQFPNQEELTRNTIKLIIEVIRIRSMVTMIPLEICQKTRSIRMLILSYANKNNNG
ncbi:PAS domain S-box family protein, putative [Ichthyophthirius multifiliis]|uniref:PAS domain S-box family protein, putative n=1 Tax=Ichthyophthirius multifiliis TaxID=5932 RepID=G0QIY9_ICHMU|nr:PAS domain S-box family protein, putative [Ichthyophthirius multifiliis]EGR34809.1 PAS domain S-box family protein, putative [Ichthyophthirius multifiliis]|eukprot:XP_004040113.1 PAS domain S-box family protein, putative [Ichthyophthirius multifiliis]